MARDARHVANGIEAVIESAEAVSSWDIWVDVEDVPEAIRQFRKLAGVKPKVYAPTRQGTEIYDKCVCLEYSTD